LSANEKEKSVLNANLDTVLPFMDAKVWINNGMIEVTMSDHTIRTYSLQGEIIEDFHISEVSQLYYDTNEIRYNSTKTTMMKGICQVKQRIAKQLLVLV
jgi:hypothetical protein